MGEVYRARDTRLDRTVAIKVLPAEQAGNAELRQRQEREARAVSSLSHPNICALFDIGFENGTSYLVMEYIEGQNLADRLAKGPLESAELLRYAIQIADALDHAHRKGVLHRDLKPANIMLTKTGAKLLDFGLAKFEAPVQTDIDATVAMTSALTEKGMLLGTFQYMAPEQLEGKPVDARTDIFAFGAMMYEMGTAKRAFEGASRMSVMTAIMERDPAPLSSMQTSSKGAPPPALDRVVQRCLAKDPDQRWQTARDLMLELQWIAGAGSQVGAQAPVLIRRQSRERIWKAAVVILAVLLCGFVLLGAWFWPKSQPPQATRFLVPLPNDTVMPSGPAAPQLELSPDGRTLAFTAGTAGKSSLWLRPLNSFVAQQLDRTDGAQFPFWSPDGQSIGFFAERKLKRIALSGGPPQTICDSPNLGQGGTWNRDGIIVFSGAPTGAGLMRVAATGGLPEPLTALDQARGEYAHMWPQFLPDGQHFLYLARSQDPDKSGIFVQKIGSAEKVPVMKGLLRAVYTPPGQLLFVREGTLFAQSFDAKRFQLSGEPKAVAVDINYAETTGRTAFSVSESGALAFRSTAFSGGRHLAWYDRHGKSLGYLGEPGRYYQIALSPDERRLAVVRGENSGQSSLLTMDVATGILTRLTLDPQETIVGFPVWSPDSERIAYKRPNGIAEIAVNSGARTVLMAENAYPEDWTLDGRSLVLLDLNLRTARMLDRGGDSKSRTILESPFEKSGFRISPDGRQIAYASFDTATSEVYVAALPDFTGRRQVSSGSGLHPVWRKDGKELFFLAPGRKLMAAEIKPGAAIEFTTPKPLFSVVMAGIGSQFAVTADGRFLCSEIPLIESEQLNVVLNWPADLKH
jgi:serine/threonine protein kinase/Tol biopolymer transport system component